MFVPFQLKLTPHIKRNYKVGDIIAVTAKACKHCTKIHRYRITAIDLHTQTVVLTVPWIEKK